MHQNFYQFEAKTHQELGLKMGQKFKKEAQQKLRLRQASATWKEEREHSEALLEISTKYFPEYIEEAKGYAEGAGMDFLNLWTISLEEENEFMPEADRCTSLFTNNNFLVGHAEDAHVGQENDICLIQKKLPHISIFEIYYYNTLGGNAVSINSDGYAVLVNTVHGNDREFGLPRNLIARYVSETKDPVETYETLCEMPRGAAYNYNIISKSGEGWNIEHTSTKEKLSKIEPPFVHTNHYLTDLKEYELKTPDAHTFSRYHWTAEQMEKEMTAEEIKTILLDQSLGPEHSIFNERTIGQMILDVKKWEASIWLLREGEKGWQNYSLSS